MYTLKSKGSLLASRGHEEPLTSIAQKGSIQWKKNVLQSIKTMVLLRTVYFGKPKMVLLLHHRQTSLWNLYF